MDLNWIVWVVMLILGGLVLVGAEVYVPGLVVGTVGVIMLLSALGVAYPHLGGEGTVILFVVECVLALTVVIISLRYFPNTRFGRKMVLSDSQTGTVSFRLQDANLIGKEGEAHTMLRPIGVATIDGVRLDVVSETGMIPRGAKIKVTGIVENRVMVRPV